MKHFFYPMALTAALAAGVLAPVSAAGGTDIIEQKALGKGIVTLWQRGAQLGVTIDKAALASLPNNDARVDLQPRSGAVRLVEIDWNAHGHPPAGVYTVPHFDAHFYVISKKQRDAIAFAAPGTAPKPPDAIVPAGYVTDGAVEPQMGMHYVSPAQPEFHGKPFMATQIWGYDHGRIAFVEAMFSRAFVSGGGSWTQALAMPKNAGAAADLARTMSVFRNAAGGCDIVLSK